MILSQVFLVNWA